MSPNNFIVLINGILLLISIILFIICLVFFIECIAALLPSYSQENKENWQDIKVTILVPAHNEELVIAATIEKITPILKKQDRLVVIADNCSDRTVEIARARGATVIERYDSQNRGKGYALDYGLQFIKPEPSDVVLIIDADCTVHPHAIEKLTEYAIAKGRPVQGTYLMTAAGDSKSSKDFVAQFANIVRNLVRPRGLNSLGQSTLLNGTGMAFPWSVITTVDLASGHIVEDMKLGLDLAIAGHKPAFCQEAKVTAPFPSSLQTSRNQKTRWEHGHLEMIKAYVPILLKESIYQKRIDLFVSALDLCIPPLSLLIVIWVTMMAVSGFTALFGLSFIPAAIVATAGFCFLMAIIIAWAKFARQDLPLGKLLTVPFYIFWKIPVYLQFLVKPQKMWVRTTRDSIGSKDS